MSIFCRQGLLFVFCLLMLNFVLAAERSSGWPAFFESATEAVVRVQATTVQERKPTPFDDTIFGKKLSLGARESKVSGTGFFIENKGMLLTTQSIVGDAKTATIEIGDGRRYQAKVIGADEMLDVALLQIDNFSSTALTFGDSTSLRVGTPVATIGFPFEMGQSFWVGIISAHAVPSPSFPGVSYLQAAIHTNRGQAGSPLVNERGEVVGMLNSIYTSSGTYSGISLAHPSALLLNAINDLKAGKPYQRRYIGISAEEQWQPAPDGSHEMRQVVVLDVSVDSPASNAGIESGDVITQFNGEKITSWNQFAGLVQMATPSVAVPIAVQRGTTRLSLAITPALQIHDTDRDE